jgi:hypothetical protein
MSRGRPAHIGIGDGPDGNHFLISGRYGGRRIRAPVAGSDDPADCAVQGIGAENAYSAVPTKPHVDDIDHRAPVSADPVEPVDDRRVTIRRFPMFCSSSY